MTLTQRLTELLDSSCDCGQKEKHKDMVTAILTAIKAEVGDMKNSRWKGFTNEGLGYNQAIDDVLEQLK